MEAPHRHLARQLRRLGLTVDSVPSLKDWQALLEKIGKSYEDVDLERYTLERSVSLFEREMKDLNRTLAEERDRFHNVFQRASIGILQIERDGRITMANTAIAQMLGYEQGELVLMHAQDIVHPDEREISALALRDVVSGVAGEAVLSERRLVKKAGTVITTKLSMSVTRDSEGLPRSAIAVVQDVSDTVRLELELRHAQKLESVGRLAAGIAHEINTPIQFVGDNTEFLQSGFVDLLTLCETYRRLLDELGAGLPTEVRERIEDAEATADIQYLRDNGPRAFQATMDGVRRVAKIVKAMKAFAHPDQGRRTMANLNDALQSTITVGNNELKYVADVVLELGDIPTVSCYLEDLNQVFLNLLVNAAHAISDVVKNSGTRGRITVRTYRDGGHVVVSIADTGTGIPEEVRPRLFEPFFTTKEVGRGTGQGLAISRSVVDKHGGSLTFETETGKGTTFIVRIPIKEPRDSAQAA